MLGEAMNVILHLPLGIKKVCSFPPTPPFASFFLFVVLNWSQIIVPGPVLSSELRGETGYSLSAMWNL